MSDYKAFRVELADKIAHVQINRPDKINAMNADFWREIIRSFSGSMTTMRCVSWCSPVPANTFLRAST